MAPGRSEPGEGRAQSSASHEERVAGHSPMADGKADTEVKQHRTFLNISEVGGIQVPRAPLPGASWRVTKGECN